MERTGADGVERLGRLYVHRWAGSDPAGGHLASVVSQKFVVHRGRRGARMTRREEGEYREYATDEQRSQPGCIAGRMPKNF